MAWTVLVVFVMAIVRAGRMRRTAPVQDQFFKLFCYSNVASLDANTRDFITSTKSMRSYLTSRGHDRAINEYGASRDAAFSLVE